MKKFAFLILLILTPFLYAQKKEIVAVVGAKEITLKEFLDKYETVKNLVNPPTKEQFLEDYIRYQIGLQEAYKRKYDKDPLVIDQMEQAMYKALIEKELSQEVDQIKVSEAEMRATYKENPEIRASHILIQFKLDASPEVRAEARTRALEIYKDVKKSKRPFAELAKIYSDDALTKNNGGDLGFQGRTSVLPQFYERMIKMKIGDTDGVWESPFGFHIVHITGRRTYEEADKGNLKPLTFDIKRRKVLDKYFDTLKKSYPIKTNKSLIQ